VDPSEADVIELEPEGVLDAGMTTDSAGGLLEMGGAGEFVSEIVT
jgi:hypothetical protein